MSNENPLKAAAANETGKEMPQDKEPEKETLSGMIAAFRREMSENIESGKTMSIEDQQAMMNRMEQAESWAAKVEHDSVTDALTQIPNLRGFNEALKKEIARFQKPETGERRGGGLPHFPLGLLRIDLDFFKEINDKFDHSTGDMYLQEIVTSMRRGVRLADTVARVGGDEFVILMPECDPSHIEDIAERFRALVIAGSDNARIKLQEMLKDAPLEASEGHVSASMGFAELDLNEDSETFQKRADFYGKAAKVLGKNAVVIKKIVDELDPDDTRFKELMKTEAVGRK